MRNFAFQTKQYKQMTTKPKSGILAAVNSNALQADQYGLQGAQVGREDRGWLSLQMVHGGRNCA